MKFLNLSDPVSDPVAEADYVIHIGLEAGPEGGEIVVEGTPEVVARCGGGAGRVLSSGRCCSGHREHQFARPPFLFGGLSRASGEIQPASQPPDFHRGNQAGADRRALASRKTEPPEEMVEIKGQSR